MTPSPQDAILSQPELHAPGSQPAAPDNSWQGVAAHLPADISDQGYDAIREKYFYENVAPQALQHGYGIETARQQFIASTPRADKSPIPRTMTTLTAAGEALTAPISGMSPYDKHIQAIQGHIGQQAQDAAIEAQRQGISPTPYQWLGQAAGMAPYFAEGMMGPEALGEEAALKGLTNGGKVITQAGKEVLTEDAATALAKYNQSLLHRATTAGSVGLIQGAYDAAIAPEGQGAQSFAKGAATGAALAGGFEAVGGLASFLRARHGLSVDEGKAVEAVAKGLATPRDEALATNATVGSVDLDKSIGEFVAKGKADSAKQGQPVGGAQVDTPLPTKQPVFTPSGRVRILMTGADWQTYHLGGAVGLKAEDITGIQARVTEHLNAGGSIQSINGDPAVIQSTLSKLAEANPDAFSLDNPIRPLDPANPPAQAQVVRQAAGRASSRATPLDDIINSRNSLYHSTSVTSLADIMAEGRVRTFADKWPEQEVDDEPFGVSTTRFPNDYYGGDEAGHVTLVIKPQKSQPFQAKGFPREGEELVTQDIPTKDITGLITSRELNSDDQLTTLKALAAKHNLPLKVFDTRVDLSSYRASLAKQPENMRWAVNPADIPDYDKVTQLPSGEILDKETGEVFPNLDAMKRQGPAKAETSTGKPPVYGIVRGSSDIPLSLNGQKQVSDLAERIAAKGSLDELDMADLKRHRQTADAILDKNKLTTPGMSNPALKSWGLGGLEGREHTPAISSVINELIDNPHNVVPGAGPYSTSAPESFQSFQDRLLPQIYQRLARIQGNQNLKLGMVTSSRDIGLVKAWLAKEGPGVDSETFRGAQENPGSVYRVAPTEDGKSWGIRAVDMDADAQLKGGLYMIRHGETPWNKSARELQEKDTPLSHRFVGANQFTNDETGAEGMALDSHIPGGKPSLFYRDSMDKGVVFHENLHGHFGVLGMHEDIANDIMNDPMAEQIYHSGFAPVAKGIYGDDPSIYREEVYVHGADAIRTGNQEKIDQFVEADTDRETYLNWMTRKSQAILDNAAEKADSLHKRTLERRVGSVISRATRSLNDVNNIFSQSGKELDYQHGQYALRDTTPGVYQSEMFTDRESALTSLEPLGEPINSPELVPLDRLPDSVPRMSKSIKPMATGERPNVTDPPSPEITQARGGIQLASRFFRPFNDWIATVSQRNSWPELYDAFHPMDKAQVEYNNTVRPKFKLLQNLVADASDARQSDYMKWFKQPNSDFVKHQAQFTPEELAKLDAVKSQVLDPLESEFGGLSLDHYVNDILPKVAANKGDAKAAFPKVPGQPDNFMVARLKRGALDPNEQNFTKLVAKYLEFGAFDKHVAPVLDAAQKVVDEELPQGGSRAGALKPLLQRHIDYMHGQPDWSQQIIKGAIEDSLHYINKGLAHMNSKLGTDIKPFDEISDDPLGKYALFSYAGALALKPATIIRDGLQIMLTTFPVAGKYTFRGIEKAFGAFDKTKAKDLWSVPQRYGALIEKNDLRSLYTGTEDGSPVEGKLERIANWGMRSIQFTHNSNRLAAFWGHSEQVLDALDTFNASGDQKRFVQDSGLWFMNQSQRQQFLDEVPNLRGADATNDYSYRIAKELTELSQWNFKRGANPGLYEYQLGRLFGQYGTWPLNYIEYARRLATSGDGKAASMALSRLVLAHGAVLAAGQGFGVDTGRWVFTGPMAYSGGPIFEAVTAAPSALAPGEEGDEAREKMLGIIPGFDRAASTYDIFKDVITDSPDYWPRVLGFHVMHGADYESGMHRVIPREDK